MRRSWRRSSSPRRSAAFAGFILAVPGVRFRSHNLAMVTFVFQAVVIIALREAKTLTGGAEGLNVPSAGHLRALVPR